MPKTTQPSPSKMPKSKPSTKISKTTPPPVAKKLVAGKKVKKVLTPPPVPTTDVVEKPVVVVPPKSAVQQQIDLLGTRIVGLRTELSSLNTEFRTLCKLYTRERRDTERLAGKRSGAKRAGNSKPSGFAKPGYISPELCNFLGKPNGTEMARTDVTRYLTTYIKDKGLQNKENKKQILCDAALQGLLKPNKDDIITYFNLQSYMKRHYNNPNNSNDTSNPILTT